MAYAFELHFCDVNQVTVLIEVGSGIPELITENVVNTHYLAYEFSESVAYTHVLAPYVHDVMRFPWTLASI